MKEKKTRNEYRILQDFQYCAMQNYTDRPTGLMNLFAISRGYAYNILETRRKRVVAY